MYGHGEVTCRTHQASLFQAFSYLGRSAENSARRRIKKVRFIYFLARFSLRCAQTN